MASELGMLVKFVRRPYQESMGVRLVWKIYFFGEPLQIAWAKFFCERMSVEVHNECKEWVRSSLNFLRGATDK